MLRAPTIDNILLIIRKIKSRKMKERIKLMLKEIWSIMDLLEFE